MDLNNGLISKVRRKMPLEALLFFMYHIWLIVIGLTAIAVIGTGIQFGLSIYLLFVTLFLFVLFFIPTASILLNIIRSKNNFKKVLCCAPILVIAIFQTMTSIFSHTKLMIYESHPDSLIYALLFPINQLLEIVVSPIFNEIFYMGFPHNQLPQILLYIVLLPLSLFIYLLPSVDYDRKKTTKEMKLIVLLPLLCVAIPMIIQIIKLNVGLIDDIMIKFFWVEIFSNIRRLGFFY
jgi:hypothetical protein